MEVDISKKVNYFLKYGVVALVLLAVVCAIGVWQYKHNHHDLTINDAKVSSTLVGTKVRAPGTIEELLVADGDHVEAGDVIAKIHVNVTDEQLQQLQQNVDLAKRNLAELQQGTTTQQPIVSSSPSGSSVSQADVEHAAARMERMNNLYAMGAISAVKRDEAAAEYASAQAAASSSAPSSPSVSYRTVVQPPNPEAIKNAELQVKQAEAALETAKQDSMATDVVAPVAGTVYLTDVAAGTEVKAGQTIVNIGDAGNIWLEAHVALDQKGKIRLGQFVSYTIDQHIFKGTVQDVIDPSASDDNADDSSSASSDGNTEGSKPADAAADKLTVKISLPADATASLKPGTRAVVRFSL